MKRAALLPLLAAVAAGCAHTAPSPTTARETTAPRMACDGLGALVDLHHEVASSPTDDRAPLAALTDVQAELAAARSALAGIAHDDAARAPIEQLAARLEERRAVLLTATRFADETHAAAASALREATTCRGIDLAAVSVARAYDKAKSEDLGIARSKACEPTLRVWAVVDGLDLASRVSVARAAAQLVDQHRGDRLRVALERHAKSLAALAEASEPSALVDARDAVREATESTYRACLTQAPVTTTAKQGERKRDRDPRSATVMVRPTWSGALRRLPSAGALRFGSGFVVRWNEGTFVVTNRHVMDGAVEADILFASDVENAKRAPKTTRTAKLVAADASDDIAVLRIEGDGDAARLPALAFRLEPAREQEAVVAAGFPGIGAMPSFQVTRGVVSNAHFASEEQDAGIAYLQHTAAIDPGNSGGPLLDDGGRLIGMNTAKVHERENVSFAIPTSRVRFALTRAEHPRRFDALHAEAACNVALDALAAERPAMTSVRRFGLALFDESAHHARAELRAEVESPIDDARVRAFEAARDAIDGDGGLAPFATCSDVAPSRDGRAFVASVRTKSGVVYRVGIARETDELRVVSFTRAM